MIRHGRCFSSGTDLGARAIAKGAQGVKRVIENLIFFDVIGTYEEQFFDAGSDRIFRVSNSLRQFASIDFKQSCVIKNVPSHGRTKSQNAFSYYKILDEPENQDRGSYGMSHEPCEDKFMLAGCPYRECGIFVVRRVREADGRAPGALP